MINTSLSALPDSIRRIDEREYVLEYQYGNEKREAIFEVDAPISDPEFGLCLVKEASDKFLREIYKQKRPNLEAASFEMATKTWRFTKKPKVGKALELASSLSTFIHKHNDDNVLRYRITTTQKKQDLRFLSAVEGVKLRQQLAFTSSTPLMGSQVVTPDEFEAGIRAKEALTGYEVEAPEFSDPFTVLATVAYQKHEKVFHPADFFKPEDCDYCLVVDRGDLVLVSQREKTYNTPQKNKKAIQIYKDFLIKEYGIDKINYIQHLYRFNFESLERLTPEVIFRVNMGLANTEVHDLNHLLKKLGTLNNYLEQEDALNLPLKDIYDSGAAFGGLTGKELRGFYKLLQTQKEDHTDVTLRDVKEWLKALQPKNKTVDRLANKQFNELLAILHPTPEEIQAALTGRRIYDYIQGYYTSAGREEYKPQVDQQQLLQMFQALEESKSELEFHEKLAHVISKVHLVREHPTEGYRVGAIIPATRGPLGEQRWYKISSCCSNGHGLFSYTLEPAYNDPSLPPIKLYRSTASNTYFMENSSSILSDFNAWNSPGFEGLGLGDKHEAAFFGERTIPVWVGYAYLAKQKIDAIDGTSITPTEMVQAFDTLRRANQELIHGFQMEFRRKNLREIIKANDAVMNDLLLRDETFFGAIISDVDSRYMELYSKLHTRYGREMPEDLSQRERLQMREDAAELVAELDTFPLDKLPPDLRNGIKRIKDEIDRNILGPYLPKKKEVAFQKFFSKFQKFEKEVDELLREGKPTEALEKMKTWHQALENYAKGIGESIDQKKQEDIVFSGHSLGGVAGAANLVHFTVGSNRMPLPGHTCKGIFFDSPGVNEETNREYLNFLIDNRPLLESLGIFFDISQSFEAGDVVHFGGEVHLGATDDEQMAMELRSCSRLFAVINERLPSAKMETIAKALTAHGTRFQEGEHLRTFMITDQKERADFVKTVIDSTTLSLIDRKGKLPGQPLRKKEYEHLVKNLLKVHPSLRTVIQESVRTSDHPLINLYKRILKNSENLRGRKFADEDGVFYVSEKGVESASKN